MLEFTFAIFVCFTFIFLMFIIEENFNLFKIRRKWLLLNIDNSGNIKDKIFIKGDIRKVEIQAIIKSLDEENLGNEIYILTYDGKNISSYGYQPSYYRKGLRYVYHPDESYEEVVKRNRTPIEERIYSK